MKKWYVLVFLAVICIFLPCQVFSSGQEQQELERLNKLAEKKIQEAKNLKIAEKADTVARQFGFYYKSDDLQIIVRNSGTINSGTLFDDEVTINYRQQMVFKAQVELRPDGYRRVIIEVYKSGPWIEKLENIYQLTEKRKLEKEIKTLKENFGLE